MNPENTPTFDQITRQHEQRKPATVLVRRSPDALHPEGWISTGWYSGRQASNGLYEVIVHTEKGAGSKWVSPDRLSDAGQEELANELGSDHDEETSVETLPRSELLADLAVAEVREEKEAQRHEEILEMGEEALEVVGVEEPTPEPRERPNELPTAEAAKKRIEAIMAAGSEDSTLSAVLASIGSSPAEILSGLKKREVRDGVRSALQTRLQMLLPEMPYRIRVNSEKNAEPKLGYPNKIRSQDYAVEIALAYLDGSFKAVESLDGHGEGGIGEHREAAQKLLESFTPKVEGARDKLEFESDRLRAFMLELGGRLEGASLDLSVLTGAYGVLDVVQQNLYGDFIDPDNLTDYVIAIDTKLEDTMRMIYRELNDVFNLKHDLLRGDANADVTKAEHVEEVMRQAMGILDSARNSFTGSLLNMNKLRYGDTGHTIHQLQLVARHGSQFEEEFTNPVRRAQVMFDELAGELR